MREQYDETARRAARAQADEMFDFAAEVVAGRPTLACPACGATSYATVVSDDEVHVRSWCLECAQYVEPVRLPAAGAKQTA